MTAMVDINGREIIDTRGYPAVARDVLPESGVMGRATVASGALTGTYAAIEMAQCGQPLRIKQDLANATLFADRGAFHQPFRWRRCCLNPEHKGEKVVAELAS